MQIKKQERKTGIKCECGQMKKSLIITYNKGKKNSHNNNYMANYCIKSPIINRQ